MTTQVINGMLASTSLQNFDLVRTAPNIGMLVVSDDNARAKLQTMVDECREFSQELAKRPNATIQVEHLEFPVSYLDHLADLYARCEFVFLTGNGFYAREPFFTEFWDSLEEDEQEATRTFTAFLIAQGRLQFPAPNFK